MTPKASPAVYRRRRLVALLLLILVIALVWWGVSGIIGWMNAGSKDAGEPVATASETAPATATAEPAASAPAEAEATTTPTPTPTGPQPCNPAVVLVTAKTDALSYAPDAQPKLSFSIENTGGSACTLNVGTAAQVFRITSGSDVIWVSSHCQTGAKDQKVLLEPGKKFESPQLTWVRERSTPDTCDEERPAAIGGDSYYHLTVSVDGVESEPTMFVLE